MKLILIPIILITLLNSKNYTSDSILPIHNEYNTNRTGESWYISIDGSDETGDGSIENPFATIQHGINVVADGDTIQI